MANLRSGKRRGKKRVPAFRKKQKNILGITIGLITLVTLSIVMVFGYSSMTAKRDVLAQQAQELQTKIENENERTTKLEEYETYTHTKKFAEETAKDVLGYVYDDEIVFKLDE